MKRMLRSKLVELIGDVELILYTEEHQQETAL